MLNQVAVEALYSATYLEDYLDGVENLPNDLQRLLSRMREFDVDFQAIIRDLETLKDKLLSGETNEAESSDAVMLAGGGPSNSNPASSRAGHWRKRILQEVQKALISSLEIGDEKLQLVQAIQDVVENKARQLETDSKNLEFGREQEVTETTPKDTQTTVRETSNGNNNKEMTATTASGSASDGRQSKRPRRSRNEAVIGIAAASTSYQELDLPVPTVTPVSTTTMQQRKISSASNPGSSISGKKKKRRSVRGIVEREKEKEKEKEKERSNSPPEIPIDPDEPTYCLCDQVSYGEMIGCDNDLCPIEWFHFSCVQLLTKPKGKWFCPRCRGDRPTVMKPKAQFLKELERYNKEKEEKA